MVRIKLSRTGKKNQPSYRIIVAEARSKRDGKTIDSLGSYQPIQNPPAIVLDKIKYQEWIKRGAQPTKTVSGIYKRA